MELLLKKVAWSLRFKSFRWKKKGYLLRYQNLRLICYFSLLFHHSFPACYFNQNTRLQWILNFKKFVPEEEKFFADYLGRQGRYGRHLRRVGLQCPNSRPQQGLGLQRRVLLLIRLVTKTCLLMISLTKNLTSHFFYFSPESKDGLYVCLNSFLGFGKTRVAEYSQVSVIISSILTW